MAALDNLRKFIDKKKNLYRFGIGLDLSHLADGDFFFFEFGIAVGVDGASVIAHRLDDSQANFVIPLIPSFPPAFKKESKLIAKSSKF